MLYDFKRTSRQKKNRLVKISRIFPFFLVPFLIILFAPIIKKTIFNPPSVFNQLKKEVLKHPRNPQTHFELASFYLETNNLERVEKELELTLELDPSYQKAQELKEEIKNLKKEPKEIKEKIQKWEKVLAEKPGYRDVYLRIGILNWQIYQEKEGERAIKKALEIDPTFQIGEDLKGLFSL